MQSGVHTSIVTRPTDFPSIAISKNTLNLDIFEFLREVAVKVSTAWEKVSMRMRIVILNTTRVRVTTRTRLL